MRRMTRSIAFLELVLLLIAIPTNARASRRYVRVPDVDWSAIEPYLRVHVVPEVRNGALAVFVCTGRIDRSAVNGYDEDLGDFTKAFLFDALLGSKPIQRGFSTLKERLLDRVSPVPSGSVEVGDLAELPLREALWNELRM